MPKEELQGISSYYDFNMSWFAAVSRVNACECCGVGWKAIGPLSRWEEEKSFREYEDLDGY